MHFSPYYFVFFTLSYVQAHVDNIMLNNFKLRIKQHNSMKITEKNCET